MGQEAGAINLIYRMMQEAILCLVLKEPLLLTFCQAVLTEIGNPRPHSRRRSPLRYRGEAGGRPHLVSRSNCEAESRRRRSRSIGKPGKYIQTGGKHRDLHTKVRVALPLLAPLLPCSILRPSCAGVGLGEWECVFRTEVNKCAPIYFFETGISHWS